MDAPESGDFIRDHVSNASFSFTKTPTTFEFVVDRPRRREREGDRGSSLNPLLDSSPAPDCSIATTRGMLSTTASKRVEEIPILLIPLGRPHLTRELADLRFPPVYSRVSAITSDHFHRLTFIDRARDKEGSCTAFKTRRCDFLIDIILLVLCSFIDGKRGVYLFFYELSIAN